MLFGYLRTRESARRGAGGRFAPRSQGIARAAKGARPTKEVLDRLEAKYDCEGQTNSGQVMWVLLSSRPSRTSRASQTKSPLTVRSSPFRFNLSAWVLLRMRIHGNPLPRGISVSKPERGPLACEGTPIAHCRSIRSADRSCVIPDLSKRLGGSRSEPTSAGSRGTRSHRKSAKSKSAREPRITSLRLDADIYLRRYARIFSDRGAGWRQHDGEAGGGKERLRRRREGRCLTPDGKWVAGLGSSKELDHERAAGDYPQWLAKHFSRPSMAPEARSRARHPRAHHSVKTTHAQKFAERDSAPSGYDWPARSCTGARSGRPDRLEGSGRVHRIEGDLANEGYWLRQSRGRW